jgi:hypothetical protein
MNLPVVMALGIGVVLLQTCYYGNNKVSGGTNNTVVVEISYPICDREDWTFEQIVYCIDLMNEYTIKAEGDQSGIQKIIDLTNEKGTITDEP